MGTSAYYKLDPSDIFEDICSENEEKIIEGHSEGIDFVVFPHVYPSHKFRSTALALKNIKTSVEGKTICDMGCGPGTVGLFAIHNGAKKVVQADINPYAVANAKENNRLKGFDQSLIETYQSDCFDNVPKTQIFDMIVFNMPYHCDDIRITDPLQHAFYDPNFTSIKKFLNQAKDYSHKNTEILIAFSNKGDTSRLEKIFEKSGYEWELWKVINTDQDFDNRTYRLLMS